jgi:hypothetical protein
MDAIDRWDTTSGYRRFEVGLGSHLPTFLFSFEPAQVLRALAKIGINLLAASCCKTPVNRESFPDVVRVIMGKLPVSLPLLSANGFVHAVDIQPIKAQAQAHSFRLLHYDGHWCIYSSFFGGRIGSFIRFRGPNHEEWDQADIVAPLGSPNWTFATTKIIQPLAVRMEWRDLTAIIPSVEMLNTRADFRTRSNTGNGRR